MGNMVFEHKQNQIVLVDESMKIVACVSFTDISDKVIDVDHTFVDDSMRGQGIAGKLMEELAKNLQKTNRKAKLSCSYAAMWFEKHPEHKALIYNVVS